MKIKEEYELEMIDKMISDLDTALLLIKNVEFSVGLSNYKNIEQYCFIHNKDDNRTVHNAYNILHSLFDKLIEIKHSNKVNI